MRMYISFLIALVLTISAQAQSTISIDPKDIRQSPSYRLATDTEKALWNRAAGLLTTVPSGIVAQDDNHRFVTLEQIAAWNKKTVPTTTTALTASDVIVDPNRQFVSEADKIRWNKNTRIESDFNIQLEQVNDSTIRPVVRIPSYNTYDRDRLPAPAPGKWIFIFNADTKKINFRTSLIPWTTVWSD